MKKLNFDSTKGFPIGKDIFYKCVQCGETIASTPEDSIGCSCSNIFIDIDYARISIKDESKLLIYREEE